MVNLKNLADTLVAIDRLHDEATHLVEALAVHIRNEPDHGRAGELRRMHQVLTDLSHSVRQARQQFQAKRAA